MVGIDVAPRYPLARPSSIETAMQPSRELAGLVALMARLRDPKTGCPWDIEQDFSTIKNYTIEEAYEVADAIERTTECRTRQRIIDERGDAR